MTSISFASLHAGLLARKGEARPSVEPEYASVLAHLKKPASPPRPVRAPEADAAPAPLAKPPAVSAAATAAVLNPPVVASAAADAASSSKPAPAPTRPRDKAAETRADSRNDKPAANDDQPAAKKQQAPDDASRVRIQDANAIWPARKPARAETPPPAGEAKLDTMWQVDLPAPADPADQRPRARSSLRLTPVQARALKLAALVLDRPQQDLVSAGLDAQLQALACTDLAFCACFKSAIASLKSS